MPISIRPRDRSYRSPLFAKILLASCLICNDIPCIIPPSYTPPRHDKNEHTTCRVSGDRQAGRQGVRSSKRRRRHRSIVDSGATIHCIKDRSLFTFLDTSKHVSIRVADKQVIRSEGVGDCAIKLTSSNGHAHTIILRNCVYMPSFSDNLISTRRLWRDNKISTHLGDPCYFKCHASRHRYYFNTDMSHDIIPEAQSQ